MKSQNKTSAFGWRILIMRAMARLGRAAHTVELAALVAVIFAVFAAAAPVPNEDRKHWSFLPLTNLPLPAMKNTSAVRTPVDRFIIARLEEKKLELSSQADARTLVRRIY